MTDITKLTAKLKSAEQHAERGWDEAIAQEARAEAAEKRIAELEESNAQVLHSRDHYKRIVEEGLKKIAKAGELTVKLQGYAAREGHPINEGVRGVMFPKGGGPWLSRFEVEHVLECAGIKVRIEGE